MVAVYNQYVSYVAMCRAFMNSYISVSLLNFSAYFNIKCPSEFDASMWTICNSTYGDYIINGVLCRQEGNGYSN